MATTEAAPPTVEDLDALREERHTLLLGQPHTTQARLRLGALERAIHDLEGLAAARAQRAEKTGPAVPAEPEDPEVDGLRTRRRQLALDVLEDPGLEEELEQVERELAVIERDRERQRLAVAERDRRERQAELEAAEKARAAALLRAQEAQEGRERAARQFDAAARRIGVALAALTEASAAQQAALRDAGERSSAARLLSGQVAAALAYGLAQAGVRGGIDLPGSLSFTLAPLAATTARLVEPASTGRPA